LRVCARSGRLTAVRALFVILASLVAALVVAVLLGPRLVDGVAVRERILARLEASTGQPAKVLGRTEFALVPEPRLSLSELVVGDPQQGGPSLHVERVDLVLGLAGLVGAGGSVRELRLVRPLLRARAVPTAALLGAVLDGLRGGGMPVGALSVVGGRAVLRDPRLAQPLELADLNLEAAQETGGGPLVVSGGGRWRDQPLAVEAELRPAAVGPASLRAQLGLGAGPAASRLAYRGALAVEGQGPRLDGELELAADTARLARLLDELGRPDWAAWLPPMGPFAARGRLRLDPARVALEGLRLATAAGELALEAGLGLGSPRELGLRLEAGRLELPPGPAPARLAELLWREPPADLVGTLTIRIGVLARAGQEARLLHLDARLPGAGGLDLERLTAELPGTGDVELAARLEREPAGPTLRGRLALRAEDSRSLLAWLGLDPPLPPERLGALAVSGALHATPEGASLADAELRLAGTRGHGTLAILTGPPPRLVLRGKLDRVGLDPWLDAAGRAALAGWLLGGPPAGLEAELDLESDRVVWQGLRAERVRARGELGGGTLRLDELRTADLGGATARLAGSLGRGGAVDLTLELSAPDPARLARALDLDPSLPALLDGPLGGRASLVGEAAARSFSAELLAPDGRLAASGALLPGALAPDRATLTLELGDTGLLAARMGVGGALAPGLAGRLAGETRLARTDAGWRIDGELAIGRLAATAALELRRDAAVPALRGRVGLDRLDAASVAELYRLLEPLLRLPPGPLRSWPGAWPRQPFGPPLLPPGDLELALELGLVAADGTPLGRGGAELSLAGEALALDGIDLPLAGGRLTGRLLAGLGPAVGRIEAALALASVALPPLAEALRAGSPPGGLADLELALASEGRSLAELLANAGGRGSLTVRGLPGEGLLPELDGGAGLLLRGPFTVERGLLRAPGLTVEGEAGSARAALAFDLAAWILDLELRGESGSVRLLGPPDRPRRYEAPAARPVP
jgi:hypothetical protein